MDSRSCPRPFPLVAVVAVSLAVGAVLKLFVVDILHVSGRSMMPSIADGERIVVNRLAYGVAAPFGDSLAFCWAEPRRGDVVIYLYNDKIVVKRCVAVGGDPLSAEFCMELPPDSQYTLRICGGGCEVPLSEPQYLALRGVGSVPDGYILAVGDNYRESVDSRTYGFVATRSVLGRVVGK